MNNIGQIECLTQNRRVKVFTDKNSGLGYRYLGNREDRPDNKNIEEAILHTYLVGTAGYAEDIVKCAIYKLQSASTNFDKSLYENNKEVYKLLRYGVEVTASASERYQRVHFINWDEPEKNDFGIAEEVTVLGNREKRPDIVLYVNGIALGVLELKPPIT